MTATSPEILPGAEPYSADGGPHGALVLHGFTGNPSSMRGVAEALAAAGFAVELPRLPGHGTTVEDMIDTGWDDWTAEVERAYADLAARADKIVVCGLSMGGALTAWVATRHPEVAGLVFINAVAEPVPEMREALQAMADAGEELMDGVGNDVADPEVTESAYTQVPIRALLSTIDGIAAMQDALDSITAPSLIMTSPQDHVVAPSSSDHLAARLGGPVERVTLERSYHVATIDFDRDLIEERVVAFARRVTGS